MTVKKPKLSYDEYKQEISTRQSWNLMLQKVYCAASLDSANNMLDVVFGSEISCVILYSTYMDFKLL